MKLSELSVGQSAVLTEIGGEGALRQHFLDMGLIPGSLVTLEKFAPLGDPMQLDVHGYELTLRLADAEKILVDPDARDVRHEDAEVPVIEDEFAYGGYNKIEHPGLGEGGKYHDAEAADPLPEGEMLTFALAGNQNSGKTTLFNQLTGANQHVGNFPGVTVDRKDGMIRGMPNTNITDLPGIYSMSPYSKEELVTRQFILDEHPRGIINIVDATNIERNMYLTLQLIELDVPMVVALNMMDEVRNNGGSIRVNDMEAILGVPVVPISASRNEGVQELVDHAVHVARNQERPQNLGFCGEDEHGGALHRCIHGIMNLISDHAQRAGIPPRFAASKLVEGDQLILEKLELDDNEKEMLEHIIVQMEKERGMDRSAAMADMRFSFIQGLCQRTVVKPRENKGTVKSRRVDKLLTGKYTALPVFILIMGLIFWLTFNVIGLFLQDLIQSGIDALAALVDHALAAANVNDVIHSLIIDGVFAGVGTVVSFVPIIVTLFFFLALLEDSGYMARVAFVMDKLLRKIGLSGRSIVPMLVGFGCTVPGVMASRTLPSERDRIVTILLIPFMSCSAKIPIYGFLANAFFPGKAGFIMIGLYVLDIIIGILMAFLYRRTLFRGDAVPFVMELPNYRMPGAKNVLRLLWDKSKDFLYRAFTVIFIATIVIWALTKFDFRLNVATDSASSILSVIAGWVAPIFKPLGFADWRVVTALVAGFLAKESVVSTLSVLLGAGATLASIITPMAAGCLLIFCLLYTPCAAAIASIKRELGSGAAVGVAVGQCIIAWIVAFVFRFIFLLF